MSKHPRLVGRCACWGAMLALLCGVLTSVAAPLSVETFFKKPKYGGATLAPSGRYLAVVTPINGRLNVAVMDLDTRAVNAVTSFSTADVFRVVWQNDDRMVVVVGDLQRASGEPPVTSGIWAVNRDATEPRAFAEPVASSRFSNEARGIGRSFERPWAIQFIRAIRGSNDVLVMARERTFDSVDVYRYDTVSGRKTLLTFDAPGKATYWVMDFQSVPRAVVAGDLNQDKSAWYVRKRDGDPWTQVEEAGLGRLKSTPLFFSPDGKTLYVESRKGRDLAAIYEYDVESGKMSGPVVAHPERDISGTFITDSAQRELVGLRYVDDKPSVVWFDPRWARMQKSIDAALPDTVNFLQQGSGGRWIVVAYSDRNPGDVYLLDGKTMKMEKLFSYVPWIDPSEIAPTQWVRYKARDGLVIPALLTVPASANGKPVPLIVDIHGGPNVPATTWGYHSYFPEVNFFASRGYAVLQPQFRGTDGFGWKHYSAGFRKWGDEMQDDLEDGVRWAVAQGIADPDRVCFVGASYGGYAAMWGAIKNAQTIKCAVAFVGVSSIDYLFDNAQTDMALLAQKSTLMVEQIGDPGTERERFKRVNPLDNADKVGVPILLAYGAEDRRVPLVHGTDFRSALDKYHKPYEWVVYAEEGHGFTRDEDVFDFYNRVEKFLAKYLGSPSAVKSAGATQ
jgi:dipeptidyl aminopeptidase/acylaminoacyl peptidase